MSLPSQGGIGFGGATRGRRRRGGRGPRKLVVGVVVIAVVGGVAWAFTRGGDEADPQGNTPATPTVAQSTSPGQHQPQARDPLQGAESGSPTRTPQEAGASSRLVSAPAGTEPQQRERRDERAASGPDRQSRTVTTGQGEQQSTTPPAVLATPAQEEEPLTVIRPSAAVATLMRQAEEAIKANDPVRARELYNAALLSDRATAGDRAQIRQQMAALNQDLMFSPRVYPNDPFATTYEVQRGDSLSRIAQNEGVATEWRLIQRVNRLSNPGGIYAGQKLKLVRGPFNAVVSKSAFRMDVYVGPPEDIDQWVYVRSFDVGLGEHDGTPLGVFTVRRHSKLINPFWRNPRTGEEFAADDPDNPIGERWVGLRGLGQAETFSGYGIHGTIEPDSIGREMSMGCVRMRPDDVALVYELLTEEISRVHIVE